MKDILYAKSCKWCFTIQITLPYLRNELAVGSICGLELDAYSNVLVMHIVMLLLGGDNMFEYFADLSFREQNTPECCI